jgi:hypothetical protein
MMGLDEACRPNVRSIGHRYVEEAKTKVSAVRADKCADKCVHTLPRRAVQRAATCGQAEHYDAGSCTIRL